jgi:hypothetical protein
MVLCNGGGEGSKNTNKSRSVRGNGTRCVPNVFQQFARTFRLSSRGLAASDKLSQLVGDGTAHMIGACFRRGHASLNQFGNIVDTVLTLYLGCASGHGDLQIHIATKGV